MVVVVFVYGWTDDSVSRGERSWGARVLTLAFPLFFVILKCDSVMWSWVLGLVFLFLKNCENALHSCKRASHRIADLHISALVSLSFKIKLQAFAQQTRTHAFGVKWTCTKQAENTCYQLKLLQRQRAHTISLVGRSKIDRVRFVTTSIHPPLFLFFIDLKHCV